MTTQNYKNHARLLPLYHGLTLIIIVSAFIGSIINLAKCLQNNNGIYAAALITAICLFGILIFFFARIFGLKAQDRAIRAEENLRHFVLTGKLLDKRLRMSQVIALRFASDEEFVELAQKAAENNMSNKEIKLAVKNWRADNHRV